MDIILKSADESFDLHYVEICQGCDGKTIAAKRKGKEIQHHPDTGEALVGVQIPFWSEIIEMSERCYKAIPLGYLGVDICIDETLGPLVLEVNGRPGLEIQNVTGRGFYNEFMEKLNGN